MNFLENLMGGGQQQQDYQDFVNRYEQGHPAEGYDDQEVVSRYQEVTSQLPPEEYQQAAREAFERMSPDERMQFARYVQQQAQQQNYNLQGFDQPGMDDRYQDPGYLAQVTSQMHQQQPGLLGQLLGGGGAGGFGSMLGGGAGGGLGGMLGGSGGGGSLLSNPMAKAALAGIASYAVKRMMNR